MGRRTGSIPVPAVAVLRMTSPRFRLGQGARQREGRTAGKSGQGGAEDRGSLLWGYGEGGFQAKGRVSGCQLSHQFSLGCTAEAPLEEAVPAEPGGPSWRLEPVKVRHERWGWRTEGAGAVAGGTGEGPEAWPLGAGLGDSLTQAGLGEESGANLFSVGLGVRCCGSS